jgi:hypothetical protein
MSPGQMLLDTNAAITDQLNIYRESIYGHGFEERFFPPNDEMNEFILTHSDLVIIERGDFSEINQLISKIDFQIIKAHGKSSMILSYCANIIGVSDDTIDFHIIDNYMAKTIALLLDTDKNFVRNALDSYVAELESKSKDVDFITRIRDTGLLDTYYTINKVIKSKRDFFKKSRTIAEPLVQIRSTLIAFRNYFKKSESES